MSLCKIAAQILWAVVLIQCFGISYPASMDEIITGAAESADQFGLLYSDTGDVLIELDMFLTREQWEDRQGRHGFRGKRKAIRNTRYRWTDKTIPYQFQNAQFSFGERRIIQDALAEWEKYTCVKFRPADQSDRNRIHFQNGGGCSSFVGMIGGQQPVTLGRGCRLKKVVVHEVGHAVGFQHEQTRPDRDNYVTIQEQNIPNSVLYNFQKYSARAVNSYGVEYDYTSIMHYGARAFSKNGQPTIIARDYRFQNIMGNAEGLSFRDIKLANIMYDCAANCARKSCPDEGFLGKDCRCYCPGTPLKVCSGDVTTTRTTARPTPRPTTAKPIQQCSDRNLRCRSWMRRGECTRNKGFMQFYCKKSCDLCDDSETKARCEDLNQHCATWSSRGFCRNRLYQAYVRVTCPKSCDVCSTNELNDDENDINSSSETNSFGSSYHKSKTPVINCKDNMTICKGWANLGYCKRSPAYMNRSCKRSCNTC